MHKVTLKTFCKLQTFVPSLWAGRSDLRRNHAKRKQYIQWAGGPIKAATLGGQGLGGTAGERGCLSRGKGAGQGGAQTGVWKRYTSFTHKG